MSKGVSKELKTEIHRVLGDMVSGGPATRFSLNSATGPLQRDAAIYLSDKGAFKQTNTGTYRLTAYGREYWDRLNTPTPVYWCKENWFPAVVALATILASLTGAVANLVS